MTLVEVDLDELRADVCDKLCKFNAIANKQCSSPDYQILNQVDIDAFCEDCILKVK